MKTFGGGARAAEQRKEVNVDHQWHRRVNVGRSGNGGAPPPPLSFAITSIARNGRCLIHNKLQNKKIAVTNELQKTPTHTRRHTDTRTPWDAPRHPAESLVNDSSKRPD